MTGICNLLEVLRPLKDLHGAGTTNATASTVGDFALQRVDVNLVLHQLLPQVNRRAALNGQLGVLVELLLHRDGESRRLLLGGSRLVEEVQHSHRSPRRGDEEGGRHRGQADKEQYPHDYCRDEGGLTDSHAPAQAKETTHARESGISNKQHFLTRSVRGGWGRHLVHREASQPR